MNHNLIKQLEKRLQKLNAKITIQMDEVKEAQRILSLHQSEAKDLRDKLEQAKQDVIVVTDHARLRFLERALGVTTEEVDEKILTKQLETTIRTLGNGKFPNGDGLTAVVKGGKIVTVY